MRYGACFLGVFLFAFVGAGCASQETGAGGAGGGSSGETDGATTTASTTASTTGGGCAQDCSEVQTPPCYESMCNTATGACDLVPSADGVPCEDGLYCTVDDTCGGGTCKAGDPRVCMGSADECVLMQCDEDADACVGGPVPNGSPCSSADICQINAICQNGVCLGAPKDCSSTPVPNECNVAQCDAAQNGACVVVPKSDGAPCIIGDPCESNKQCSAGACLGTPIPGCSLCPEVEPNDSIATATDDPSCTGFQGQIGTLGDNDYFAVDVTVAGARIRAQTTDLNGTGCPAFDSVITLYDANGVQLAQNDTSPVNSPCSLIDLSYPGSTNLAVGTYYVRVQAYSGQPSNPYLLLLNVFSPGCGDGIIQAGEECDDENTLDGDGCSSSCELFTCMAGETEFELPASGLPLAITDYNTTTSNLVVAQTGTIVKLGVALNVTHTYTGDLVISLDAPGAASVVLADQPGFGGDNLIGTVFSSDATNPITNGVSPFTGVYTPQGGFGTVVGTALAGTWTLSIYDDAGGDSGTLDSWKIIGCAQP